MCRERERVLPTSTCKLGQGTLCAGESAAGLHMIMASVIFSKSRVVQRRRRSLQYGYTPLVRVRSSEVPAAPK